jgi:hypothetical protein
MDPFPRIDRRTTVAPAPCMVVGTSRLANRRLRDPAFLIVGTARSGTTLVQRLSCEIPGVWVPPETHFFSRFAPDLLRRRRFPLNASELLQELEAFCDLRSSRELHLDPEAVGERLGGRCDSPVDLFGAIVRDLAGDHPICGEKTPDHIRWWRPLALALPDLKFISVVRDPRAVAASTLDTPWAKSPPPLLAERWRLDQREVRTLHATLGSQRSLILRYEDMVQSPDHIRALLGDFLPIPHESVAASVGELPLYLPWKTWKDSVNQSITPARVGASRHRLTPAEAASIEASS